MEVLTLWDDFFYKVRHLAQQQQIPATALAPAGEDAVVSITKEALGKVERITSSLSRITEAMSFQDLSGQRLLKVLNILRQLQVQVLTLLVAAGQKLKVKVEGQDIAQWQQEKLGQEELDRMLQNLTHAASEDGLTADIPDDQPLDQDSVNDLLSSLGF